MLEGETMSNTNCLKDMACPWCTSEGDFLILIECEALVSDEGIVAAPVGETYWDDGSFCVCRECGYRGKVSSFCI